MDTGSNLERNMEGGRSVSVISIDSSNEDEMSDDNNGRTTKWDANSNKDDNAERWLARKKTCRICGEISTGHNFGVITCESCKAFFRRHGRKKVEDFICLKRNTCEINMETRRTCQKCRLRKCFKLGMAVEKLGSRMHKVQHHDNEQPHRSSPGFSHAGMSTMAPTGQYTDKNSNESGNSGEARSSGANCSDTTMGSNVEQVQTDIPSRVGSLSATMANDGDVLMTLRVSKTTFLKNLMQSISSQQANDSTDQTSTDSTSFGGIEWAHQTTHINSVETNSAPHQNTDDSGHASHQFIGVQNEIGNQQEQDTNNEIVPVSRNAKCLRIDTELDSIKNIDPSSVGNLLDFTTDNSQLPFLSPDAVHLELTAMQLEELHLVNEVWNKQTKAAPPLSGYSASEINYTDFLHFFHHVFTHVVKQHRQLSMFRRLSNGDQLRLLQGRLLELTHIRIFWKSPIQTDLTGVQYPGATGGVSMDWSKRVKGDVYEQTLMLKRELPDELRPNETLMLLVSVIILLDPSHVELTNRKMVNDQRGVYLRLLKTYLESTYGSTEARHIYKKLLSWLNLVAWYVKNCCSTGVIELSPRNYEIMMMAVFEFQ